MQGDVRVRGATGRRVGAALRAALAVWAAGALGPGVAPVAAQTTAQRAAPDPDTVHAPRSGEWQRRAGSDLHSRGHGPRVDIGDAQRPRCDVRVPPFAAANARVGLIRDLRLGKNELVARTKGREPAATLTVINHPVTGPVIAGPHQTPFVCETEAFGLGPALDSNCSAKTRVEYFYRSKAAGPAAAPAASANSAQALAAPDAAPPGRGRGGANAPNPFKPFDPAAPRPADLAETTTSDGRTVPFIVRREMGTVNRAVYVIAFLHEPGQPLPDPWTRHAGLERPPDLQLWWRLPGRLSPGAHGRRADGGEELPRGIAGRRLRAGEGIRPGGGLAQRVRDELRGSRSRPKR